MVPRIWVKADKLFTGKNFVCFCSSLEIKLAMGFSGFYLFFIGFLHLSALVSLEISLRNFVSELNLI